VLSDAPDNGPALSAASADCSWTLFRLMQSRLKRRTLTAVLALCEPVSVVTFAWHALTESALF
jgi:hypothetical protein